MSSPLFPKRFLLGALLAATSAHAAPASVPPVLPFGAATWGELARSPARPLAVVFSTTDCAHCPAAIDKLATAIRESRSKVRLVVVVMDGAGQEEALRDDGHYRDANALYAFDGDATALRYRVNPGWRGLTPYVALVPAEGATRFFTGAPPLPALQAFLQR